MWAVAGGKVTAYLRAVPNLLGLSVIPSVLGQYADRLDHVWPLVALQEVQQ